MRFSVSKKKRSKSVSSWTLGSPAPGKPTEQKNYNIFSYTLRVNYTKICYLKFHVLETIIRQNKE